MTNLSGHHRSAAENRLQRLHASALLEGRQGCHPWFIPGGEEN
jgi:hypothetical protein